MYFLYFVSGQIVGMLISGMVYLIMLACRRIAGTLKIDRSDPDKDKYLFEISDLDSLAKKKTIVLKIDNSADLSQK